jgi:hypothetical protein
MLDQPVRCDLKDRLRQAYGDEHTGALVFAVLAHDSAEKSLRFLHGFAAE